MRPVNIVFLVGAIMVLLFAAGAFQPPDGDDGAGERHDGNDSDQGHDSVDTDEGHAGEGPGDAPANDGGGETPAADDTPETPAVDETPETPAVDDTPEAPAADGTPETPGADDVPGTGPEADGGSSEPEPQGGTGNFQLLISDKPADIADFSTLKVNLSHARVFMVNATNATESNWTILDLNGTWVELTTLIGNKSLPVLNGTLKVGNYTKIELHLTETYGLVNGTEADVKVPSGKLMITMNFTVEANKTTMFVFDMHVVKKGNGGYNLRPVITESGVVGKHLEDVVIVG